MLYHKQGGDVIKMTNDKVRFTLRIPEKLYKNMEKEAKSRGISLNSQILVVLDEYVKKSKTEQTA